MAALAVAGIVATGSPGAAGQSRPLPQCAADPVMVANGDSPARRPAGGTAWSQLAPRLDDQGALVGQHLELGTLGGPSWQLDLPPEAFAAGPADGLVVVGDDDGRTSSLRLVDAASGCSLEVGREASVVRSAALDPAGIAVFEHRVDRSTRTDLGIWRRPILGDSAERVVAPFGPDPEIGTVWTTTLFWSTNGDRLVVASCGAGSCRHRIHDPVSGRTEIVAGPPTGDPIGASEESLVAFEACGILPCAIVVIDLASGAIRPLVDAAGPAVLVPAEGGPDLVYESPEGDRVIALAMKSGRSIAADLPAGRSLLAPAWLSGGGVDVGAGTAVLSDPDRRAADPSRLTLISIDPAAGEGSR